MNRTEFIEMQNEFADYLYEYEKVIKEGYLLDLKYNKEFSALLVELHNLEIETGVMKDCLEKLQAGEAIENLNAFIAKVKESFQKKLVEIEKKNKRAVEVTNRTEALTDEEKKDFEEYFHEFVKEYYPPVKLLLPPDLKPTFDMLKHAYYDNNISFFKEVFELNRISFMCPEIPENDYPKVSAYYYDFKKKVSIDRVERTKKYPYIKKDVFTDEMSIKAEEGELLMRISKIKSLNKVLKSDFVNAFGYELNLSK